MEAAVPATAQPMRCASQWTPFASQNLLWSTTFMLSSGQVAPITLDCLGVGRDAWRDGDYQRGLGVAQNGSSDEDYTARDEKHRKEVGTW